MLYRMMERFVFVFMAIIRCLHVQDRWSSL